MPSADDAASIGGFQRHSGLLLTIIVTGADTSTTLGTSLPARETFVQDFRGLTQEQVAGRFVIEAGPGTQLNRVRFSSDTDYRFVCSFVYCLVGESRTKINRFVSDKFATVMITTSF